MSAAIDHAQIRRAIQDAGEGWLFSYWGDDSERHVSNIGAQIDQFIREYEQRFGETPDPFLLLQTDPYKGKAFFQSDTFMVSTEMQILIWRILIGYEIVRAEFQYEIFKEPSFVVTLRAPNGPEDPPYKGKGVWDFKVLRHFGASSTRGGLVLQGYYASRRT